MAEVPQVPWKSVEEERLFTGASQWPFLRAAPPLYITKGRGGGRKRLIIQLIFTVQPDNAAELLLVYTVFSFCVSKTHTRLTFNKNPNNAEPPEPRETAATGAGEETVDVKTNGKSLFSAF